MGEKFLPLKVEIVGNIIFEMTSHALSAMLKFDSTVRYHTTNNQMQNNMLIYAMKH